MAAWVHYFNLAAVTSALVVALLGLLLTLTAPYVKRWERGYFGSLFSLLSAYTVCDFVEQVSQYFLGPGFLWLSQAGVFLELLFSVAIVPMLTAYLLRCAGNDLRKSTLMRVALVLYAFYVVVLVAAQFSDAVYYLSVAYQCVLPGPFYPVLVVAPVLLMALNLAALVRLWPLLSHRQRIALAACTAVPLVCVFVQTAFFGLSVLVVGISASALVMLGLVLAEQTRAHIRQREEAALQHARVLALQMRPHFIYNVMTSIYYLCAQDPARARQVTLDFTDYLRANFNAVAAGSTVPFSKELEHTRAYLAVESARFEDGLVVDIDCPHTAFRLPPLTLQPLVENSVKHGTDPELPPLHVRITTCEESACSIITVEDTGPGFDASILAGGSADEFADGAFGDDGSALPAYDDVAEWAANPATALANIRERLAACGATLDLTPREGGGTVATIRVPVE